MFLRSERLFLRPAWAEDAPELARAIGHEAVARMLAHMPWPYAEEDARRFVEQAGDPYLPRLLITLPAEGGRIVGGCGLHDGPDDRDAVAEVGYWITPDSWGRGYATEALCGLLSLARLAGHRQVAGRHAADNPASGRVLRKLGFHPTGRSRVFHSLGRDARLESFEYAIDLAEAGGPCDAPMRQAA